MKRLRKLLLIGIAGLLGLCLLALAASALSNLGLPERSEQTGRLSQADKLRLREVFHLQDALGDEVWPGYGQADIPAVLYNEEYSFLVGYPDPPAGWRGVPAGAQLGGPWEPAPGDTIGGETYYRQRLPGPDITPQAFTVRIGDRWASSLQTLEWAQISLVETIRADLPAIARPVFPYRLFLGQLVRGSDQYITLVAHEAFHAFQGISAPEKLAAAELAGRRDDDRYPWEDEALIADWQTELDILVEALRAGDTEEAAELVRAFLEVREARRESAGLDAELIAYEQQREWTEGLARYAELEFWRLAEGENYAPLPETAGLPDFNAYAGFDTRWQRELEQMRRTASDEGDGRFYYTGMAQAVLLDRLMPGWKELAFEEGIWLEGLLEEAAR